MGMVIDSYVSILENENKGIITDHYYISGFIIFSYFRFLI